jgi:hypothetical protein
MLLIFEWSLFKGKEIVSMNFIKNDPLFITIPNFIVCLIIIVDKIKIKNQMQKMKRKQGNHGDHMFS